MNLIDFLIAENWLKTPQIIEAFKKIKRVDFLPAEALAKASLPEDIKNLAELDEALPIGLGQTISQPLVVAFMLELLCPQPGHKILDIGSGSGWTSALLADIVGKQGKVIAIEIIPELKEFGKNNAIKYQGNIKFVCTDGSKGYPKEAPFDRIMASASLQEKDLPLAWKEQLATNGVIVTPIKNSIWTFKKLVNGEFEEKEYPGFIFVPFI